MDFTQKHLSQIHEFDSLPDSANVRLPVVKKLLSCSKTTVWRLVNKQTLPHPIKCGRLTMWNVGDLRTALQKMKELSRV